MMTNVIANEGESRTAWPQGPRQLSGLLAERRTVVAGLAVTWLAGHAGHASEPAGVVEMLRGEAYVQAADHCRALALASPVFVGDFVHTGAQSALGLRLGSAILVRLGGEAQLRIDRFLVNAGGILDLARGGMVLDREPTPANGDIAVRSPFGLIAVRGTRFFAGPSNGLSVCS